MKIVEFTRGAIGLYNDVILSKILSESNGQSGGSNSSSWQFFESTNLNRYLFEDSEFYQKYQYKSKSYLGGRNCTCLKAFLLIMT